ncbi:prolyl oligopeptidase family serine peptidase [Gordonia araii NBRC 100433]|nr:prolyl oligopeptidase family serine peptidase [Gordonia araii NBRC 100433]
MLAVAVGSLVALSAVGAPSAFADSRSTERVGSHSYELYRPSGLASPAPLVVVLHGGFGTGKQVERDYGWNRQARAGRFVVAYPDGIARSWNAGGCCGQAQSRNVDDLGFLRRVVDDVARKAPVDRKRVFIAGMSNGAMMALRAVCQTSVFRGAVSVAGTLVSSCERPASVLQIHGTADPRVRYQGGTGSGSAQVDGQAIEAVDQRLRRLARCPAPKRSRVGTVVRSTATCPSGRVVELITIEGMGHQWPGASKRLPTLGPPSSAINATQVAWRYFARL